MKQKKIITKNAGQTQKLGEKLAKEVFALRRFAPQDKNNKRAVIFGLQGDLGSGKTTFLQGFAKGLGIKEKILSPTFVIFKRFEIKKQKKQFSNFYHFDCYRIQKPKEILDMGFKEIILNPKNIVAIEWPEKIKKFLPKPVIIIKFKFIDKKTRELIINKFDKVF
ncbi:MAG: tRNA (adenosine(37)-N6)-threonylcarbamoyltransferase complex ATPase subunit type 1 TsaE [bacterium]|nr:tRNA (adenosine(37)-N6)-threonylcarbamoyltransferase complex ATPase subunit type 1 TsaE [bacterium]